MFDKHFLGGEVPLRDARDTFLVGVHQGPHEGDPPVQAQSGQQGC